MQDRSITGPTSLFPAEAADLAQPTLLARLDGQRRYWDERLSAGLDPWWRIAGTPIGPVTDTFNRAQERFAGLNFTAYDHLSLSSHPQICAAATEAVARWGLHSASPAASQGIMPPGRLLEERLAELLCCREATLFPSGWAAGFTAVRALAREPDHIVLDVLSHPSLHEAARASGARVYQTPNCEADAVAAQLEEIRATEAGAGILVVTHSFFVRCATVPDLPRLRDLCRIWGATLLVAVAGDLGAYGNAGLGFIGESGLLGEVDVLVGSLARCFATNGGFIASRVEPLKHTLRGTGGAAAWSTAISPIQAAVALAALDIVRSAEGARRRQRLAQTTSRLRDHLAACAFQVPGRPAASVPLVLGDAAETDLATREALARGVLVEVAEQHHGIPEIASGWLLHLTAGHTLDQVDRLVEIAVQAVECAHAALPGRPERISPIRAFTPGHRTLPCKPGETT